MLVERIAPAGAGAGRLITVAWVALQSSRGLAPEFSWPDSSYRRSYGFRGPPPVPSLRGFFGCLSWTGVAGYVVGDGLGHLAGEVSLQILPNRREALPMRLVKPVAGTPAVFPADTDFASDRVAARGRSRALGRLVRSNQL